MKTINQYIQEKLIINRNTNVKEYKYRPESTTELKQLVKQLIDERGNEANLNDINTSEITDMSELFKGSSFNGDISLWDVSNVENMNEMFKTATKFNGDISKWDVGKVTDMSWMFCGAEVFNQPLNDWNVSNVEDMDHMFAWAESFNQKLGNWKVSKKTDRRDMFKWATNFNIDEIQKWNL